MAEITTTRLAASREVEADGRPAAVDRPLQTVVELVGALDRAGIRYCHWKSNAQIGRSERGDNDLDLLVDAADFAAFAGLVTGLGFLAATRPGPPIEGIRSFYAWDRDADRLVHLHAHDRLVLGHDRTKNYRLPIEAAYLASATRSGSLFPLPAAELEYAVLVIRMALKYCIADEVLWNAARRRRTGPKRSEREELAFLGERLDRARLADVLADNLPGVGAALFDACERAVTGSVSLRERIGVGKRLEQALQTHARRSREIDAALRVLRRVGLAVSRRTSGPPPRARLAGGGALIALIGGDGAGKSTALEALSSWLGSELDVRVVHMGKPPWSVTTYAARAAIKGAGIATGVLRRTARVAAPARAVDEYRPLVWFVCTARDRSLLYRKARRTADEGIVVLCDRYPHGLLRLMDVPQVRRLTSGRAGSRLLGKLIELEEGYHDEIGKPEQMFVLRVDPEVAAVRKTTESSDSVRSRGAEIWTADWEGSGAYVVDASRPAAEVAAELKTKIWSSLS